MGEGKKDVRKDVRKEWRKKWRKEEGRRKGAINKGQKQANGQNALITYLMSSSFKSI